MKSRRRGRRPSSIPEDRAGAFIYDCERQVVASRLLIDGPVGERKGKRQADDSPWVCVRRVVCTRLMSRPITPRSDRQNRGAAGARNQFSTCMVLFAWYQFVESSSSSTWRDVSGCQCMHAIRGDFIAARLPTKLDSIRERSRTLRTLRTLRTGLVSQRKKNLSRRLRLRRAAGRGVLPRYDAAAQLFIETANSHSSFVHTRGSW